MNGESPWMSIDRLGTPVRRARILAAVLGVLIVPALLGISTGGRPPSPAPERELEVSLESLPAEPQPPEPPPAPPPVARPQPEQEPVAAPPPDPSPDPESAPVDPEQTQTAQAGDAVTTDGESEWALPTAFREYSGGATTANGTSTEAIPAPPPKHSRARTAWPLMPAWNCVWPGGTDLLFARARVKVTVDLEGRPAQVEVVQADAPVFAEPTRECALKQMYRVAWDDDGKPIVASTPELGVVYHR